jgi:membrane protease YdiL (CAAX protease family)
MPARRFIPWSLAGAWLDVVLVLASAFLAIALLYLVVGTPLMTRLCESFTYDDAVSVQGEVFVLSFQMIAVGFLWAYALLRGYGHVDVWSGIRGVPTMAWIAVIAAIVPYSMAQDWFLQTYFPEQLAADTQSWTSSFNAATAPLITAGAVILAPLSEELIFRRVLIEPARPFGGMLMGASVMSSAVWAIIHFYSWPSTIILFFEGLLLCWLAVKFRSIWPGIMAHALFNGYAIWWVAMPTGQPSA